MTERVSLVIPVFNEEANLDELIDRCVAACEGVAARFEIVLVDDGSSDSSAELIRRHAEARPDRVVGVLLNRNVGQHSAVLAGFARASGDVVVTLDADLQNPPEEIPKLLAAIAEGHDVVGSVRVRRRDSAFRRLASRLVNRTIRTVTGVRLSDYGCMLRAYTRPVIDCILLCEERSTFIPVLANSFARDPAEVDVAHDSRAHDDSRYGLWKLVNLQFDLLTSMTTFPLRVLSLAGGALAACGFAFGLLLLLLRFAYGAAWAGQGVFTVLAVLSVLMGAQLLGMGLLGEYIGRIYTDVRARPRHVVRETVGAGLGAEEKAAPSVPRAAAEQGA